MAQALAMGQATLCIVEIQQCIDILLYCDIYIKTVYLYIQYFMTDAVVVYYGCQFYSSATI